MGLETLKSGKFKSLNNLEMQSIRGGEWVDQTGDGSTIRLPDGKDIGVYADKCTYNADGSPKKMEYQQIRGGVWKSFDY